MTDSIAGCHRPAGLAITPRHTRHLRSPPTSLPNTGDKLRSSNMLTLVCFIPLFDGVVLPSGGLARLEHARCVALDDIAVLELAVIGLHPDARRFCRISCAPELVVPDRDALTATQSGRAIHEPPVARKRHEDIMRELVLLDQHQRGGWAETALAPTRRSASSPWCWVTTAASASRSASGRFARSVNGIGGMACPKCSATACRGFGALPRSRSNTGDKLRSSIACAGFVCFIPLFDGLVFLR